MTGRRGQILEAAIAVLLEVGLHAATTRAVTERAAVGTGLLNHYYRWPELRAAAWSAIFAAAAKDLHHPGEPPEAALERYFTEAFAAESRPYWHLWIEASELAANDAALAEALTEAEVQLHGGLAAILAAGPWSLPDPAAAALRLSALHDGLAGMLLSGSAELNAMNAEHHLRTAFMLECRIR